MHCSFCAWRYALYIEEGERNDFEKLGVQSYRREGTCGAHALPVTNKIIQLFESRDFDRTLLDIGLFLRQIVGIYGLSRICLVDI